MNPTPRLHLKRTRRGWMVAALATVATSGGLAAGELAAAVGSDPSCETLIALTETERTELDPALAEKLKKCEETATEPTTSTETSPPPTVEADPPPATDEPALTETPEPPLEPQEQTPEPQQAAPEPPPTAESDETADQQAPVAAVPPRSQKSTGETAQPVKTAKPRPGDLAAPREGATDRNTEQRRRPGQLRVVKPGADQTGAVAGRSDQIYFPPVSVDWQALTPLAPPAFPGSAALSFPGPLFLLPIYEAAAVQYGVPWQVLAAINEVESAWGRNQGPSSAGAVGWMQFLPSTWRTFGVDANGDGDTNPADPVDAIFSAAYYLSESGAEGDLGRAIFAYNRSNRYVDQVVQRAIELGSIPDELLTTLTEKGRGEADAIKRATGSKGLLDPEAKITSVGRAMLLGDKRLRKHILGNDNIDIYECGREDVAAGIVGRRVLVMLQYLAARGLRPTVTSLRCGHGYYTKSGNVSQHSSGNAVDIAAINGTSLLGNQGPGTITERTIKELLKLGGGMRPDQIISLMTFEGAENTMALPDHAGHIHVGFRPARDIAPF